MEPFQNVLGVTAMFALLTPDEPHFKVTVHGNIASLMLLSFGFLHLDLIVHHADVLKANGARRYGLPALALPSEHLDVLLVLTGRRFSSLHEILHLLIYGVGSTAKVAPTRELKGFLICGVS
jgi:hypothetical protein